MPRPSRFTADQKVDIVLRGLKGEDQIRELCEEVGIQPKTYYEWKKIFLETGKQGFASKSMEKDGEKESLQKENQRLKDLVADLSLENHILKKNDY
jgi:transposase